MAAWRLIVARAWSGTHVERTLGDGEVADRQRRLLALQRAGVAHGPVVVVADWVVVGAWVVGGGFVGGGFVCGGLVGCGFVGWGLVGCGLVGWGFVGDGGSAAPDVDGDDLALLQPCRYTWVLVHHLVVVPIPEGAIDVHDVDLEHAPVIVGGRPPRSRRSRTARRPRPRWSAPRRRLRRTR